MKLKENTTKTIKSASLSTFNKIKVKNIYETTLNIEGIICEVGQIIEVNETQGITNLLKAKFIQKV